MTELDPRFRGDDKPNNLLRARWLKIVFFLIVALGIGAGAFLVPAKRSFESYLHRAEEAFQKKNFNRSIELYLRALRLYPNQSQTPEVLLRIGDTYNFSLGNSEKASTAYDMLTSKYPRSPEGRQAFLHGGEMYEKNENYERALLAYQGIVDNFPDGKDVDEFRFNVAMMALKLKKFEPARRALMGIVEKNPQTPIADKVLYQLGNSFFMDGSSREAIQVLKAAIEKYPDTTLKTEMYFTMANAYEEVGDIPEALKIYKSILNLYPNPKVVEKKIDKIQKRIGENRDAKQKILQDTRRLTESQPGRGEKPGKDAKGGKKSPPKSKIVLPDFVEPEQVEP